MTTQESDPSETTPEFEDKILKCVECNSEFEWSAGEQQFYADKGLANVPKRCRNCKQAKDRRIRAIENSKTSGKNFKFDVLVECASCGVSTTVPFYPSQGRPVYCRKCYKKNKTS
ncbi:MAG: zinc-ribbon domain containing protein [Pyrinomonadaceae bacterium]